MEHLKCLVFVNAKLGIPISIMEKGAQFVKVSLSIFVVLFFFSYLFSNVWIQKLRLKIVNLFSLAENITRLSTECL